jgi:uncharacterized protein (TIGR00369 family)
MHEAPASPFDAHIGTEWLEMDEQTARGRIAVSDFHKQPFGLVHGGLYATLAESVCSEATGRIVGPEGRVPLGQSNSTTFLRPISEGHVNALARRRHAGRTTWVWDVEISDDEGRLCALVRMTIAIRPRREP